MLCLSRQIFSQAFLGITLSLKKIFKLKLLFNLSLLLQAVETPPDRRSCHSAQLSLQAVGKPVHPMFHKISCLCWAPGRAGDAARGGGCRAVVITGCPFGKEPSIATIVNLAEEQHHPHFASASQVGRNIFNKYEEKKAEKYRPFGHKKIELKNLSVLIFV